MLANRATLLIKNIDEYENQKHREIKIKKYEKLSFQLIKAKARVDTFIEFKYVLGKNVENIKFDSISKNLTDIKIAIENDKINEREGAFLHSVLDGIENQLKSEWKNYHEEKTRGVIRTLENIKPFFNDEMEIERIVTNLKNFERIWPINREKYDRFEEVINLAKGKIQQLNLTDDIRMFITKIIANTATLKDLTPNILKWLKDNNYENKIKLKFN